MKKIEIPIKPTMSWSVDQDHLNELLVKYYEKMEKVYKAALYEGGRILDNCVDITTDEVDLEDAREWRKTLRDMEI